ncbi:unnamed protein product [Peniophora sp. CBMAI 1063]|nr:unnamed protein product [Peniophora sp. CBMAI 1063]
MTSLYPVPLDDAQSTIPSTWALKYTDSVAHFAQQLWAVELGIEGAPRPMRDPAVIDIGVEDEVRHLVRGFGRALRNQYKLSWSCKAYNASVGGQDGDNPALEKALSELYPGLDNVIESGPASIVDKRGVLVLFLAEIFLSMSLINPTLQKAKNRPQTRGTWRQAVGNFEEGGFLEPGLATLGIRQSQGHEKPKEEIHVTADLGRSGSSPAAAQASARSWLDNSLVFGALMSAALAITHPEQYALARECLVRLSRECPTLEDILEIWPFAFNALAIVSNRATPTHRDRNSGDVDDYDGMCTIGGDDRVVIEFPGLGLRARYQSGTMVWTSCYMHLHSVSESPDAERVAFAAYVKQSVHLETGLEAPRAPTLAVIQDSLVRQMRSK